MSLCSTLSRIQPWLIERKVPSQKIKIQSHYYDSISLYWLYMNKCVCVFALTVICFTLAVGYGVCIEWLPVSTNTAESSRASTQLTIGETHMWGNTALGMARGTGRWLSSTQKYTQRVSAPSHPSITWHSAMPIKTASGTLPCSHTGFTNTKPEGVMTVCDDIYLCKIHSTYNSAWLM